MWDALTYFSDLDREIGASERQKQKESYVSWKVKTLISGPRWLR